MNGIANQQPTGPSTFARWLRRHRESLGLRTEQLASLIGAGCEARMVEEWEAARRRPTRQMAEKLAALPGVPASERSAFVLFAISDIDSGSVVGIPHDGTYAIAREATNVDQTAPWRIEPEPPSNLPAQLTTFVGRKEEVINVTELVRDPRVRLLTLLGPPGIGKTRLSQEASRLLLEGGDFEDGIFLVPLATISESNDVLPAVALALGIKEDTSKPISEGLSDYLRNKHMLLVLDNLEQIIGAGTEIARLLAAIPEVKMIATSREALHIYGEQIWRVHPLHLPARDGQITAQSLSSSEATDLFIQRARSANPTFLVDDDHAPAIAEVCRKLDGLPLAIELAAARTNILTPQALLTRLDSRLSILTSGPRDRATRHRTLRAAIEWSYNLLDEREKILFRYLSEFIGGFTLELAESMMGEAEENGAPPDLLDTLSSLVDKSLIKKDEELDGEGRFSILETIREFGLEILRKVGEENAARRSHAHAILALAEQAEPHMTTGGRDPWLRKLEADLENIRAVISWSLSKDGDLEPGLCLAGTLHWFWYFDGHIREGFNGLKKLTEASHPKQTAARAKALYATGMLGRVLDRDSPFTSTFEESVAIWEALQDKRGLAYTLAELGAAIGLQSPAQGVKICDESVALFREVGDDWGLAYALNYLAGFDRDLGESQDQMKHREECLMLVRRLNDERSIAEVSGQAGQEALLQGNFDLAEPLLRDALAAATRSGARLAAAYAARGLAIIAQYRGQYQNAASNFTKALEIFQDVGNDYFASAALRGLGDIATEEKNWTTALDFYQESIALANSAQLSGVVARDLLSLARFAWLMADPVKSAELLGASDNLYPSLRLLMLPVERTLFEKLQAQARASVGETKFVQAWSSGQAMRAEQASTEVEQLRLKILKMAPGAAPKRAGSGYPAGLTKREVELLRLVAVGLSNAEIAARLFLSPNTVRAHLLSIFGKVGVESRTAAAYFATQNGLT